MSIQVKSNKELSVGTLIDKGFPKEEIMKLKGIKDPKEYDRIVESLIKSRKERGPKEGDFHFSFVLKKDMWIRAIDEAEAMRKFRDKYPDAEDVLVASTKEGATQ